MNLTQVAKIARREFLARVRSRAFMLMTFMVPVTMVGYVVAMPLMMRPGRANVRLAVVDAGTGLGNAVADGLATIERPQVIVTEVAPVDGRDEAVRARFTTAVRDEALDGYLFIDTPPDAEDGAVPRVRYIAREVGNQTLLRELRRVVQSAAVGELLVGTGVDADRVRRSQQLGLESVSVSDEGEREGGFERALVSTMVLAMLLYVAVLINGQGMATAIVEEKSSRLIEVILGAVTATEFMAGKILGVLGSGLTQLGVWLAVAAAFMIQGLPTMTVGAAAEGFDLASMISPTLLFYFAVFFALGYLLYSVMFAMVAVTCTSTEELGQSMFAAIAPMVIGLMVAISVLANPSTTATRVLSLIPVFTPLVMLARVNVLMPPLWEVWLGIGLLLLTSIAATWISAKVFRYALLMTGKRPTLPELIRVVRAG
jgi:ABC-2 type transport system permease protein